MTDVTTYAPDVQFYGPQEQRMLIEHRICPACSIATPFDDCSTNALAAVRCRVCTNVWVLAARDYELTDFDADEVERRFRAAQAIGEKK